MKPYLIKEVRDNDKVVERFEPIVLDKQIAKPSTIAIVRKMLESVVDSGTASNIRSKNYPIAGKTGTNLLADKNLGFKVKKYQASFVGYFPANNPVYACIVVVNKPDVTKGYYGREVAAPVFKDIADRLYSTDKEIHPPMSIQTDGLGFQPFRGIKDEIIRLAKHFDWNVLEGNAKSEWTTAVASKENIVLKPTFFSNQNTMPNLLNMNVKDAVYILESMGMRVRIVGRGKVREQSLKVGERVWKGTEVKISLG
mgnify:CR=1 FL=1